MRPSTPNTVFRSTLAALIPLGAAILQSLCWPVIQPFVWFLFYPAVFLSSWVGGFVPGLAASLLSVGLVWWQFMEPVHVLLKPRPAVYLNAAMFLAMGVLFAYFNRRLREALRKVKEAELRARDKRMDRMSRMAKTGWWEFDPVTFAGAWTDEVALIHDLEAGTQPNVEMGLSFYHERDRPRIAEAVRRAVVEARPYDLELELVTAKGASKWIRTMGQPVVERGRVVRVEGALQDLTDRRAMELALRDSEARFRALFEQAGVGVVEVEAATGRFLLANDRFCAIVGYTREEILGMTFADVTRPDERERDVAHVRRLAAGEIGTYVVDKRYRHKDGSDVWCRLTVRPLCIPGVEAQRMVSIIEDISARKLAEEQLLELNATLERRVEARTVDLKAANEEMESFSYAISHDLRAPLRAINGFSQALQEDFGQLLPPEGREYLDQLALGSQRMAGLIDGLLRLSRAGRGDLDPLEVDVSALAATLLEELARGEAGRSVVSRIAPGLKVNAEPRMLAAALGNLLGNAWKYTARTPDPLIEVDSLEEDGKTWLRVRDNGCGFDMAYAEKLFKPFQRLHRQDEFPGLGIGLATVQRIVHRHGGLIRARSMPGEGATFLMFLPGVPLPEHP
jgi:PAS domain S-box-containing protein